MTLAPLRPDQYPTFPELVRPHHLAWPACPGWCASSHRDDLVAPLDVDEWGFTHHGPVGASGLVSLTELVTVRTDGQVIRRELTVGCAGREGLTATEAGQLVADLTAAAPLLVDAGRDTAPPR